MTLHHSSIRQGPSLDLLFHMCQSYTDKLAYSSQVSISFFNVPGSCKPFSLLQHLHHGRFKLTMALCPASGVQCNLDSGHALCSSHAVIGGQTTSYLPCTIVAIPVSTNPPCFQSSNSKAYQGYSGFYQCSPSSAAARPPSKLCSGSNAIPSSHVPAKIRDHPGSSSL